MSQKLTRQDYISYLVAISVKNNITPAKVGFADYIIKACAAKFSMDKYKAKSYINTLISTWRFNKWKRHVEESPYLTEAEKERWFREHG